MAQPVKKTPDYVQDQGKLVIQVMKERTAAREWDKNWGFLKDMRPFLEEEAAKQGMTKEEYWAAVKKLTPRYTSPPRTTTPKRSLRTIPRTSSAMIGWRADQPLEKKDIPWVPPCPKIKKEYILFLG